MRAQIKSSFALLSLTSLFMFACGGSIDKNAPSGPQPGGATATAPTPSGPHAPIPADPHALTILLVRPFDAQALVPNVSVVFDKPGGERVEAVTDAHGLVKITGIDWSLGKAAVTVFEPGLSVHSIVEIDETSLIDLASRASLAHPELARDLTIRWDARPTLATLSGNVSASSDEVALSPTMAGSFNTGGPGPYSLTVQTGAPFSIIGIEYGAPSSPSATLSPRGSAQVFSHWTKIDQPAITGDTTLNVDLSTGASQTPLTANGKVVLPGGKDGPLGAESTAYLFLTTQESQSAAFLGAQTKIDVSADGSAFDYDFEYIKLDGATPYLLTFVGNSDRSESEAIDFGYPTANQVIDNLPPPPIVLEQTRSLSLPFALDGIADDAVPQLLFFGDVTQPSRWMIETPKGVKSLKIPAQNAAMAAVLGPITHVTVSAGAKFDNGHGVFTRWGGTRVIDVTP